MVSDKMENFKNVPYRRAYESMSSDSGNSKISRALPTTGSGLGPGMCAGTNGDGAEGMFLIRGGSGVGGLAEAVLLTGGVQFGVG